MSVSESDGVVSDGVSPELAQEAHDYMLAIGSLTVRFARVERAPRYPDGRRESDVEHSFHLGLSAVELAADYYPQLDVGLVSQFSAVHDLPETITKDVWTFNISDEDRTKKEAAEKVATGQLLKILPSYLGQLLRRYEQQVEPEARFVRFIDKLLPAVINIFAGDANTFSADYGVMSAEELNSTRAARTAKLQALFPDFQFIHLVRDLVSATSSRHVFPDEGKLYGQD